MYLLNKLTRQSWSHFLLTHEGVRRLLNANIDNDWHGFLMFLVPSLSPTREKKTLGPKGPSKWICSKLSSVFASCWIATCFRHPRSIVLIVSVIERGVIWIRPNPIKLLTVWRFRKGKKGPRPPVVGEKDCPSFLISPRLASKFFWFEDPSSCCQATGNDFSPFSDPLDVARNARSKPRKNKRVGDG